MLETMKLLGSTKSEINKNEIGENVPNLEIIEVILLIIIIKEIEESCIHLFLITLCEAPLQTGYFCPVFSRLQTVNGKKIVLLTSTYP